MSNDGIDAEVRLELEAMGQCYRTIGALAPDAAVRVVQWLQRKFIPREQLLDSFRLAVEDELLKRQDEKPVRLKLAK